MMTAGFFGYLAVVAAIGFHALRRTRTAEDYVIGGRTLSAPVAALSAGASDMSGWLLLGLPGAVFLLGIGEAWIVVGLVIGAWANWRLVAAPLRRQTAALSGSVTLPQYFAARVAAKTRLPAMLATVLILLFFAIYTAAGFVAGAKLFTTTLGLDYHVALWLGVLVVLAYTALGGFLAVSWTDCFQALLMMAALVAVATLATVHAPIGSPVAFGATVGALALVSSLAWGLGYFGQPHVLARFMAIDSPRSVPWARRANLVWMVVASSAAVVVGVAGSRFFGTEGLSDPETVFIVLAEELLTPWLAGVVVAGILAAVMSTVDSQLLVASTALVEDLLRPLAPKLVDGRRLGLSRVTVAVIAIAAGAIATDPQSQVLGLVAYAWAGLGASFGPALLACLFWRRATEAGVVAGMATGAAVAVAWHHLSGGLFDLYEMVPAFLSAGLVILLLGRRQSRGRAVFERIEDPETAQTTRIAGHDGKRRVKAQPR